MRGAEERATHMTMSLTKSIPARKETLKFLFMRRDFMGFGVFRAAREKNGLKVQSVCYFCRKPFKDEDMLALGCVEGKGNKLFCDPCAVLSLETKS